jgi:hypothetical protein
VKRHSLLSILLLFGVLVSLTSLVAAAEESSSPDQPVNMAGNWQLQWEARIATEKGLVRFQQTRAKLTGVYSGPAGTAAVSGTVDGKKISFTLEFPGKYSYGLVFTGLVGDDKMNGKFAVANMKDGYDSHGENARPTDYSWKAMRSAGQGGQTAKSETQGAATDTSGSR